MKLLRFAKFWTIICLLHFFSFLYGQGIPFDTNVTTDSTVNTIANTFPAIPNLNTITPQTDEDDEDEDTAGEEKPFYDYDDEYIQPAISNETKSKTGIIYTWAKWPKWNKCSRSCGGGVQTRIRNCIEKKQVRTEWLITAFQVGIDGRKGCFGVVKKFRMCNQKACAKVEDFRNQQCASFNNKTYKGELYNWEGYIKEHHECELNCKPVSLNYYTTLSKMVIDGTPCSKPAIYYTHAYRGRAVCVEGICKILVDGGGRCSKCCGPYVCDLSTYQQTLDRLDSIHSGYVICNVQQKIQVTLRVDNCSSTELVRESR